MCNATTQQGDFTAYRHRWEMPMLYASLFITVAGLIAAVFLANTDVGKQLDSFEWLALFGIDGSILAQLIDSAWVVLAAPVMLYVYRFYVAARDRSNAIRVGERQFPEVHAIYQTVAKRLDMTDPPKLYVKNGDGVLNAYALECNRRRRYVVIHSEIAMLYEIAPDIVEFVLAHELAHHKLRHVTLWRSVLSIMPSLLVLPGQAMSRAQEYSADRVALAVCPNHASALRMLAVGPRMQGMVCPEAWLEQCETERSELFVRIANTLTDHAVLVKRFKALKDIENHGYTRHGDMF